MAYSRGQGGGAAVRECCRAAGPTSYYGPRAAVGVSGKSARGQLAVQLRVGLGAVPLPVKPKVVLAPPPRAPLYEALVAVTEPEVPLLTAFHIWVIALPEGSVHETFQPEIAELPELVTVISDWKPPGQEFTVLYVAVQP